jgi:hypothetical protein
VSFVAIISRQTWKQKFARRGIDGVISVQARQTLEETRWLLAMAAQNDFIKGVVGYYKVNGLKAYNVIKQRQEVAPNCVSFFST